eukprot:Gb_17078 [translate_table: standard]
MEDAYTIKNWSSEPSGCNQKVVLRSLISSDQNRVGLTNMDVKRFIDVLNSVGSFHFYKLQFVTLNPEVERG